MDETLKKIMEALAKSVADLHETVRAKFSSANPDQFKAEQDALVKRIQELEKAQEMLRTQKIIKKMVFGAPGKQLGDGEELVTFGRFMKAVARKDHKFLEEYVEKAATGQSLTVGDGGYAVPVEYSNELIKLQSVFGVARRICRLLPMGSTVRKLPKQLTDPTVYWVAEATAPTKSKMTFDQVTQTAKKVLAIIGVTTELLEDNSIGLDTVLLEIVARAMAVEEDRLVFAGGVDENTDPFDGVLYATSVNSASMDGATAAFGDLVNLMFSVGAGYRPNGVFVLSSDALQSVMKMKDDNQNPIWTMPVEGAPGRILGKPYYESDQIPSDAGDNDDQTAILFGDFKNYAYISDRGTYQVSSSDSATDGSSGAQSAFTMDEIWYKFRARKSLDIVLPAAFGKLLIPANS